MSQRWRWFLTYLPLALVAALVVVLPLSTIADLPLERQIKRLIGVDYSQPGCAPVFHRGVFGAWRNEGRLPTTLEEARAARVGGAAYVVGGVISPVVDNIGRSTSAFRRYDLRSGRFTSLPPLPQALNHIGVAAHHGAIYAVGGLGNRLEFLSEASASMWRYNIDEGHWRELAPMPVARGALGAAFVDDILYAVGGRDGPRSLDTVEAYDPKRDTWSERAPLPSGRDHLGVASLGGALYAVGGRYDGGNELHAFLRYDPKRDRWTHMPPLPIGTSGINLERVGANSSSRAARTPTRPTSPVAPSPSRHAPITGASCPPARGRSMAMQASLTTVAFT